MVGKECGGVIFYDDAAASAKLNTSTQCGLNTHRFTSRGHALPLGFTMPARANHAWLLELQTARFNSPEEVPLGEHEEEDGRQKCNNSTRKNKLITRSLG